MSTITLIEAAVSPVYSAAKAPSLTFMLDKTERFEFGRRQSEPVCSRVLKKNRSYAGLPGTNDMTLKIAFKHSGFMVNWLQRLDRLTFLRAAVRRCCWTAISVKADFEETIAQSNRQTSKVAIKAE